MLTLWRLDGPGTVQSDPERFKFDPNIVEQVYQLIVKDHSISRARISELLNISERQVRAAIDELRDSRIRKKGKTRSGWEIIG